MCFYILKSWRNKDGDLGSTTRINSLTPKAESLSFKNTVSLYSWTVCMYS